MGYYYNFELNGFTTQEGTGDASPSNVREIENAGMYNSLNVLNGQESGWSLTGTLNNTYCFAIQAVVPNIKYSSEHKLFAISSFLKPGESNNDSNDYEHFRTGFSEQAKEALIVFINKNKLKDGTVEAAKQYFSEHPLTIAYQSTENTGKFYTGIAVEQDGAYHCNIVELKDRLHSGDKLDTNILSEFDAELLANGSEAWTESAVTGTYYLMMGTRGGIISDVLPQSDWLPSAELNDLYNGKVSVSTADNNTLILRLPGNADPKTYLPTHSLHIFYKSASGGAAKNIKREEYTRKSRVLTGTEAITATTVSEKTYFAIPASDAKRPANITDVLNIKSNMFSASSQNTVISGDYRICVSAGGNFLLHFNETINTVNQAKQILSEKYMANTPVTIEYELAQPEVFVNEAIEPVYIKALQSYSFYGEEGTNLFYTRTSKFIDPKTNWRDLEFFNLDPDYSRLKADIEVIKEYTDSLYPDVSITNMPKEYSISDDIYSEVPNNIIKSIEQIRSGSITPDGYAQMRTYIDGQPAWNANELNTIENNVRLLYNMFVRQEEALQKLPIMLGIRGIT